MSYYTTSMAYHTDEYFDVHSNCLNHRVTIDEPCIQYIQKDYCMDQPIYLTYKHKSKSKHCKHCICNCNNENEEFNPNNLIVKEKYLNIVYGKRIVDAIKEVCYKEEVGINILQLILEYIPEYTREISLKQTLYCIYSKNLVFVYYYKKPAIFRIDNHGNYIIDVNMELEEEQYQRYLEEGNSVSLTEIDIPHIEQYKRWNFKRVIRNSLIDWFRHSFYISRDGHFANVYAKILLLFKTENIRCVWVHPYFIQLDEKRFVFEVLATFNQIEL